MAFNKLRKNFIASQVLGGPRLYRLRKNSNLAAKREGHGFSRAVKCERQDLNLHTHAVGWGRYRQAESWQGF